MTKNSLSYAGEYVLDYATILQPGGLSIDVRNQVESLVIYEDLFSPFISGILFLKDTRDLPNLLGRPGARFLSISVYTPSIDKRFKIQGVFHVYKESNRNEAGDRVQTYALNFISEESFLDQQKKISRSFKGLPHDIIKKILKENFGSTKAVKLFNYEESKNEIKYVSNFWSPMKNASYVTEHALSLSSNPTYLFFENRDGFNFTTLDNLARMPVAQSFDKNSFFTKSRSANDKFSVTRDFNIDYKAILSINVDVVYDFMRDKDMGMLQSKLLSHDLVTKAYKTKTFGADQLPLRLNPNRLYPDNLIKDMDPSIMHGIRQYGTNTLSDQSNLNYIQNRISQLRSFQASKIEIEVFGRTDYTVGRRVTVDIEQMRQILKEESKDAYLDRVYSGGYIISGIAHRFFADKHMSTLELIKDSTLLK